MNTIDLIVCIVLVAAVWSGLRQGFVRQICSLAGIVAAIWLAARFGARVGAWLHLDPGVATPGGFVVVLLAVILLVAVAARLLRKLFRFAGFGVPDAVLGVAVAVLKYLLLLSVLFAAFGTLNRDYSLVPAKTFETSKTYRPVLRLSESLFPFLKRIGGELAGWKDALLEPDKPETTAPEPENR